MEKLINFESKIEENKSFNKCNVERFINFWKKARWKLDFQKKF